MAEFIVDLDYTTSTEDTEILEDGCGLAHETLGDGFGLARISPLGIQTSSEAPAPLDLFLSKWVLPLPYVGALSPKPSTPQTVGLLRY